MNELDDFQVVEIEGDDGELFQFAVTEYFSFNERNFAVLSLVEDGEIMDDFLIYECIQEEGSNEIELAALAEEEEDDIVDLYLASFEAGEEE